VPDPRQGAPAVLTRVCFVIMPFGTRPVGDQKIDFDSIYESIFKPAIEAVELPRPEGGRLSARRTDKDFFAGDIGQDMFEYLHYSRIALADITGLNPNVMYEVGVRHAARASGTAIFRIGSAPIPFDISHVKAFPYEYSPEEHAKEARALITRVLGESLLQNRLDSPVQIALRAQRTIPDLEPILRDAENAIRNFDRPGAIAILRRAVRESGGNPLTCLRLGLLLRDNGDIREALAQFEAAVAKDPLYSEAWREKGIAENNLSRKAGWNGPDGEAALRKAIELNPDDFDALASLGGVLRRQKRYDDAFAMYKDAARVSSGHPYPLLMALKLGARATGRLELDAETRRQLMAAQRVRGGQAKLVPPFDSPWCFFDSAEVRLYLGDVPGSLDWIAQGLAQCEQRWQGETFRSALQLLVDGGVKLDGLEQGLAKLDGWIAAFPA
jgi:tetratricopeptide (TPR) repeat protein